MKKHIPTNESGRSMVEMLGVLAIMGVLSIGAVAGYRWAMDKYEANEILNEVRKRAITSSQARISGHEIDLTEYGDNGRINGKYGVVADNAYNGDSRLFTLTVSDIPQGVCDKVVDVNWQMPAAILLDGVAVDDNTVCGEGNNEMLFAFANDLKSGAVAGGDTAQPERPNTDANGDCLAGYVGENCDIRDTTCQGHGVFESLDDFAVCLCDPGFGGNNCEVTCPNKNYPFEGFDLSTGIPNGSCYSCSATTYLTGEACHTCPNRFLVSEGSISLCVSCSLPGGIPTSDVECAKCDDSGTPRFMSTDGDCVRCSDSAIVLVTAAECAKCDDSSTPRFMDTYGRCYPCSDPSGWIVTAEECAKCDDSSTPRYMNGGSCYKCPTRLSSSVLNTQEKCESCHGTWNAETKKCS